MYYRALVVLAVSTLAVLPVAAQDGQQEGPRLAWRRLHHAELEVKDSQLLNSTSASRSKQPRLIEGPYSFNGLGDKRISIPVSGRPVEQPSPPTLFASMNTEYGTANVVIQKPDGGVRPYGLWDWASTIDRLKSDDAGRLCARILRPVVVCLLPGRIRSCREHRRRTQLHRLRHGLRRRREFRRHLRRDPLSLHLGSRGRRSGRRDGAVDTESQRAVPGDDVRPALLTPQLTAADPPPGGSDAPLVRADLGNLPGTGREDLLRPSGSIHSEPLSGVRSVPGIARIAKAVGLAPGRFRAWWPSRGCELEKC